MEGDKKVPKVKSVKKAAVKKATSQPKKRKQEAIPNDEVVIFEGSLDDEDLGIIDPAATSAKDLKEIEERNALNEDNSLSTIKLYKKNHIKHLHRFTDDPLKPCGKEFSEYPTFCNKKCNYCHEYIKGIPIFPPYTFDKTRRVYILSRDPFCKLEHAKAAIYRRNKSNMGQQLGLLTSFAREFLGLDIQTISSIPINAMEDFSYYGTMSKTEWETKESSVITMVKQAPILFVDTFLEEHDIKKKEQERKEIFNKIHSIRATEDQQAKYKENIDRVLKAQKMLNNTDVHTLKR